jgi:hypothetical protein
MEVLNMSTPTNAAPAVQPARPAPSGNFEFTILNDLSTWVKADFQRSQETGGLLHTVGLDAKSKAFLAKYLINCKKYDNLDITKAVTGEDRCRLISLWERHQDLAERESDKKIPMLFVKETNKPTILMLPHAAVHLDGVDVNYTYISKYDVLLFPWLEVLKSTSYEELLG